MLAVDASRCSHSPDFQEMHLNGRTAMTFYDPRGQKTRKIPSVTQLLCISGSNLESKSLSRFTPRVHQGVATAGENQNVGRRGSHLDSTQSSGSPGVESDPPGYPVLERVYEYVYISV